MRPRLFIVAICLTALPQLVTADSHFELWKVYAGLTNLDQFRRRGSPNAAAFAATDIRRAARANAKSGAELPDETPIECKKGVEFGVGYYVQPQHTSFVSFDMTWEYPHLKTSRDADRDTESVVQRKDTSEAWGLKLHVWSLKEADLVDGDIVVMLHDDERLLLRHAFQLRDCDPLTP
jgi:hypothetical protein